MKLTASIITLICLSLVLAACSKEINPLIKDSNDSVKEINPLEITSTFNYVANTGFYIITGKVKNTGNQPVAHARVKVNFYKKDGKKVVYDTVIVYPARLAQQQEGAFVLTAGLAENYALGRYEVLPGSYMKETTQPYTNFEINKAEPVSGKDFFKGSATIKNIGNKQAPIYSAKAIFYDVKGNVVDEATDPILVAGEGLKPGISRDVSFTVNQPNKDLKIANYDVSIDYT